MPQAPNRQPLPSEEDQTHQRGLLARVFVSLGERRLRAGWRLLGQSGIMLVIAVAISIALSIFVAALAFINPELVSKGRTPESLLLALSIIVALPAVAISVWIARRALDRRSFASLGLELGALTFRDLLIGFLIPAPLFALVFVAQWGLGWLEIEGWGWAESSFGLTVLGMVLGLAAFVAVGFYEELLFRGYYLQNLRDGTGLALALFLSSAVFALAHSGNFSASIASAIGIFGAGYFLAYGWLRTSALWLPMGLHIGWNFFQGPVFGFAVSGNPTPSIVVHTVEGPELLTGGGFGPEAGLIVLPLLAIGSGLIWLYTRGRESITDQASAS
ncbi:MAG: lysostaphin resistance A-like protein [Anaerolineales bacterium]